MVEQGSTWGSARRVEVASGVALHCVEAPGEGRPFVLVHGLASNLRMWDGVAERLVAAGHHVVAVDLRGHGRSDKPDDGYEMATVADDLRSLLEALGLERPWVAGQSWGGNVVLELAWTSPTAVAGVACVDGGWLELGERFPDWEQAKVVLAPPPIAGTPAAQLEERFRAMRPDWPDTGIRGALACFEVREDGTVAPWLTLERHLLVLRGLWEHRPSTRYAEVQVPVLLLPARNPASAQMGSAEGVERATAALPTNRAVWIDGDHDIHAQHPDRVAAALLDAERELTSA